MENRKCDDCPNLKSFSYVSESIVAENSALLSAILAMEVDMADSMISSGVSSDQAQQIVSSLTSSGIINNVKSGVERAVENNDEKTEKINRLRQRIVAGCAGPLVMRAVRDGVEYTVTVCASPFYVRQHGRSAEPSFVKRRLK